MSDFISINEEELERVQSLALMKANAETTVVEDNNQYLMAGEFISRITIRIHELEAIRKKLKAPILEAGHNVDDLFRRPIQQGKEAKRTIQTTMLKYTTKIKEEQRQADVEAAKKLEEQKEKSEQKALEEMEAGNEEAAQEILDKIDIPYTQEYLNDPVLPKAPGISARSNWKCCLVDFTKLVQAVAQNKAPINLIQLNQTAANQYAKAVKDTLQVPGLEFYNDETLAVRTKGVNNA